MMTMAQVEKQVNLFSFEEQLHLLAYIANKVNMRSAVKQEKKPKRSAGGLTGKFYMASDFDEPLEDFAEYM
ncbi:MAG: DUF2281 domain-containing protein [Spirochaetaceae bacterium]|nr:DUF2281 domain-containing protein [Spirochaetaceae bacterium]